MWEWIAIIILFVIFIGLRIAIEKLGSDISELGEEIKQLKERFSTDTEEDFDV